jgi:hypothetical protein
MFGHCIECGMDKYATDGKGWGFTDNEEYPEFLCPTHYSVWKKKDKKQKKVIKRRRRIATLLSLIFPKTIKWIEDAGWLDGCDELEDHNKMHVHDLKKDRIEKMLKRFKDDSIQYNDKICTHIEKIMREKCIACRESYKNNYCLAFGNRIHSAIAEQYEIGNFGCIHENKSKILLV